MENTKDLDENTLEFAKYHKKHLCFDVGEIVYLKSDVKKKCPMVIVAFEILETRLDYDCEWINSQKMREYGSFLQKVLTQ